MTEAHSWLEARFAEIHPKAMAALARYFRDLDLAEEAFAAGCVRALKTWPEKGLPDDPFAWLLTVSRNIGRDILRRRARPVTDEAFVIPTDPPEDISIENIDARGLRDDVLRLLFICCHPSLSPQDQSALALRIVAGLSIDEIAQAFLIKPRAMEQRLTRAKRAIADANTPFETPDLAERHRRMTVVSLMVYLLFNEGWSASTGDIQIKTPLCEEAIRLARLLLELFPALRELMGLLALFLVQHSRRDARLDDAGKLVPLDAQDRRRWDRAMIAEAGALLEKALRHGSPGSYQIQAAIALVHANAQTPDETDWPEIERLYGALCVLEPTPVIRLNHASALAKVEGPQAALDKIEPLGLELDDYRWYHAARGAFLFELEDYAGARQAYERTVSLSPTDQESLFLEQKIAECEKNLAGHVVKRTGLSS